MSDDILKRMRERAERGEQIEDPHAVVIEPEIRTPSQYAMYPTAPSETEEPKE